MEKVILPEYSLPVTFTILAGILIVRYFILSGSLFFLCEYLNKKGLKKKINEKSAPVSHIRSDILASVMSSVIFALSGAWMIALWRRGDLKIYHSLESMELLKGFLALFALMFLQDTYFYWTHRLLHLPYFFKRFHLTHHYSTSPTAWTSFSFHPVEALLQALILPLLFLVIPINWIVLVVYFSLMTFFGLVNHLGYEFYGEAFRKNSLLVNLISASHHQVHHTNFSRNFGLYFTFWDKWMGTEYE